MPGGACGGLVVLALFAEAAVDLGEEVWVVIGGDDSARSRTRGTGRARARVRTWFCAVEVDTSRDTASGDSTACPAAATPTNRTSDSPAIRATRDAVSQAMPPRSSFPAAVGGIEGTQSQIASRHSVTATGGSASTTPNGSTSTSAPPARAPARAPTYS